MQPVLKAYTVQWHMMAQAIRESEIKINLRNLWPYKVMSEARNRMRKTEGEDNGVIYSSTSSSQLGAPFHFCLNLLSILFCFSSDSNNFSARGIHLALWLQIVTLYLTSNSTTLSDSLFVWFPFFLSGYTLNLTPILSLSVFMMVFLFFFGCYCRSSVQPLWLFSRYTKKRGLANKTRQQQRKKWSKTVEL